MHSHHKSKCTSIIHKKHYTNTPKKTHERSIKPSHNIENTSQEPTQGIEPSWLSHEKIYETWLQQRIEEKRKHLKQSDEKEISFVEAKKSFSQFKKEYMEVEKSKSEISKQVHQTVQDINSMDKRIKVLEHKLNAFMDVMQIDITMITPS